MDSQVVFYDAQLCGDDVLSFSEKKEDDFGKNGDDQMAEDDDASVSFLSPMNKASLRGGLSGANKEDETMAWLFRIYLDELRFSCRLDEPSAESFGVRFNWILDDLSVVHSCVINNAAKRIGWEGSIQWSCTGQIFEMTLSGKEFWRLFVHNPTVKAEVALFFDKNCSRKDMVLGYVLASLRDFDFEHGQKTDLRNPTKGGCEGLTEFRISGDISVFPQPFKSSKVQFVLMDCIPPLELGTDHIFIGSARKHDMKLSVALTEASSLEELASPIIDSLKAKGSWEYWLQYYAFGICIETERFVSRFPAGFIPIQDWFRICSSAKELPNFLERAPIKIFFCRRFKTKKENLQGTETVEPLASALIEFGDLFSGGIAANGRRVRLACNFDMIEEKTIHLSDPQPNPTLLVDLKIEFSPADVAISRDYKNISDDPLLAKQSEIQKSDSNEATEVNYNVSALGIKFFQDDDMMTELLEYSTASLVLALRVPNSGKEAISPISDYVDQSGKPKYSEVSGLSLNIKQKEIDLLDIECRLQSGSVLAFGTIVPKIESAEGVFTVDLLRRNKVRGFAKICIAKAIKYVKPSIPNLEQNELSVPNSLSTTTFKYRMKIELESIRTLKDHKADLYLKFSYPLFGSISYETKPPIFVHSAAERTIPNGTFEIEFDCSEQCLSETFHQKPLIFQLWQKQENQQSARIGVASLSLHDIFRHPRWNHQVWQQESKGDSPTSDQQVVERQLDIYEIKSEDVGERMMCLKSRVSFSGPFSATHEDNSQHRSPPKKMVGFDKNLLPSDNNQERDSNRAVSETEEKKLHRAWIDFEAWKEREEMELRTRMRERETARMRELERLWETHEKQRFLMLQATQERYTELETRMLHVVREAEARERTVSKLESELQRAGEERMVELDLILNRAKDDFEHRLKREIDNRVYLESECKDLKEKLSEAEKRLHRLQSKVKELTSKEQDSPGAAMQHQIATLRNKISELETAAENDQKLLIDARKETEIARTQAHSLICGFYREKQESRNEVEKSQAGQQLAVKSFPNAAQKIEPSRPGAYAEPPPPPPPRLNRKQTNANRSLREANGDADITPLERLVIEKNDLLNTGNYDENHPILKQINAHILLAENNLL